MRHMACWCMAGKPPSEAMNVKPRRAAGKDVKGRVPSSNPAGPGRLEGGGGGEERQASRIGKQAGRPRAPEGRKKGNVGVPHEGGGANPGQDCEANLRKSRLAGKEARTTGRQAGWQAGRQDRP